MHSRGAVRGPNPHTIDPDTLDLQLTSTAVIRLEIQKHILYLFTACVEQALRINYPISNMGLLSYLRKVYDLDTLDTRFTAPSKVPYQTVIDQRNDPVASREAAEDARNRAPASKWKTPEFSLYLLVIMFVIPYMFWVVYDVSRREFKEYPCAGLRC